MSVATRAIRDASERRTHDQVLRLFERLSIDYQELVHTVHEGLHAGMGERMAEKYADELPADRHNGQMTESDDSRDKLQAILVNRSDEGFAPDYTAACKQWFADLTDVQRALTDAAMIVYHNGDEAGAAQIVANLPAAPKRPTSGE
jgi:hypothetical protein